MHTDQCGPMETTLLGVVYKVALYFVLFKDDFSGSCEFKFI